MEPKANCRLLPVMIVSVTPKLRVVVVPRLRPEYCEPLEPVPPLAVVPANSTYAEYAPMTAGSPCTLSASWTDPTPPPKVIAVPPTLISVPLPDLDANVAGYPSNVGACTNGKGLIPWADLTQLPGSSGNILQSDVDNLINFRNATTASPVSSYPTNIANAATTNGFTRVANGDTCFLGRQDLIKWTQQSGNANWQGALPYLTTFSREVNGPTWGPNVNPASPYNYVSQEYTQGSFNPRIPNPRVQATGTFTRANGLPAIAGEPLVKYRFPLDKLALLESVGTKYTVADWTSNKDNIQTQIQEYFGLDLVTSDANPPSFRHWRYPTTSATYKHGLGTSGATGIMSLDDVAAQGREPDFFELLQAGMLSGSLGVPGTGNKGRGDQPPVVPSTAGLGASFIDPDDKATFQIIRVGANIIDQWDADSFPTTISYYYTSTAGTPTHMDFEGIEDLPYPHFAYMNFYAPNWGTTTNGIATPLAPFNFYLYFQLWNPHQTPSSISSANYPTGFRFNPYYNSSLASVSDSFAAGFWNKFPDSTGTLKPSTWLYNGTVSTPNGVNNSHTLIPLTNMAPSGIPFYYSPSDSTANYRDPALAIPPGGPGTVGAVGGTAPHPFDTNACLVIFPLTNFPNPGSGDKANQGTAVNFPTTATNVSGAWQCQYYFRMVMPVQYKDAANNWHTYGTFLGLDDSAGAFPAGTCYTGPGGTQTMTNSAVLSAPAWIKSDPRTFRFGVGTGQAVPDYDVPPAYLSAGTSAMTVPLSGSPPFGAPAPYALDLWAANDSAASSQYTDVDGILRWGDARNSIRASTVTSPLFANATANRPVILNRPFQSVGELGYVYRDMPWKSLDMFSANSADSGLLDLFTLSEAPVLAGRINPNTPYSQVLAALISGATQGSSAGTTISAVNAQNIGTAIATASLGTHFASRADFVNNFMGSSAVLTSVTSIKTEEEAVVRSLAESSNTRTWNFMIDIVAQSGRYPATATTLDNFVVEGERRYWLHVAIDRYTGQVVDKQLEVVNE